MKRHFVSTTRIKRLAVVWSGALAALLTMAGTAMADTVSTDFEGFTLGTVDGQDGWHSAVPGDIPALPFGYDQAVVPSGGVAGFGTQSLRHSNAYNEPTGEFFFQTYSKPTTEAAGESLANTEYIGEFQFTSFNQAAQQPGLFMTISPDNSTGGRMSALRLTDEAGGIRAIIFDTPDPTTGDFAAYDAGLYSRDEVHTVRFWIKLVPGVDNDNVRIFIDGVDIGERLGVCFTTWENFYRSVQPQIGVPAINSLEFRAAGGEVPGLVGGGYLFDNVTTTTANGAGPAVCPTPPTPPSPTPPSGAVPTATPAPVVSPTPPKRRRATPRRAKAAVIRGKITKQLPARTKNISIRTYRMTLRVRNTSRVAAKFTIRDSFPDDRMFAVRDGERVGLLTRTVKIRPGGRYTWRPMIGLREDSLFKTVCNTVELRHKGRTIDTAKACTYEA